MLRAFSIVLTVGSVLGAAGEVLEWELPTVRFPFRLSRDLQWLHAETAQGEIVPWFGWVYTAVVFAVGVFLLWKFGRANSFTPIMQRRIARFRSLRRGYFSLLIIIGLAALASLDHVLVGSEALAVRHEGKWSFPAFTREIEKGGVYGVEGDAARAPAQFLDIRDRFREEGGGNIVVMPPLPYAPTGEGIAATSTSLEERNGILYERDKRFEGLAARVYDLRHPQRMHLRYRYRDGLRDGPADGWDREGSRVYGAEYERGELVPGSESWNGSGSKEEFLGLESSELRNVHFNPTPPTISDAPRHVLGTNSQGYDVLAYLYGGLQVNFKAALVYIPLVYALGIGIGLLMGYFGGVFDLVVQRLIEIFSNVPHLFVVMIASTAFPERIKETAGLWIIVGILVVFGWMGMTYLMRTSALKEKARDYIAASRVLGASTPRILFRHLLPNSVAILVTLVPFSVSALILSLTSLDYLGFGLPPRYATWGRLLRDGLDNLSAPWLVTSAFVALVGLLILITFVGEAVREAFDPKKFSYYR